MTLRLVWLPIAQTEATEATRYYREINQHLGDSFVERIDRSLRMAIEHPEAWPLVVGDGFVRKAVLTQFPYLVFYQVHADELVVLGVVHCSRRPLRYSTRVSGT